MIATAPLSGVLTPPPAAGATTAAWLGAAVGPSATAGFTSKAKEVSICPGAADSILGFTAPGKV
ncbi:hypothetical protein [Trueperella pyogenes]|uniref:hypothetical protein n=1 Tax=Trueperella pyogenes TaxID=1661 RepID=UPI00345D7CF7